MKNKYLIRLDDACPTMDKSKWQRMFGILDSFGVRPMVGIIPHNEDPLQMIDEEDAMFWDSVQDWNQKGYSIALHGYNHCYCSEKGLEGLNPLWNRSEFAGVPLDVQKQKIKDGISILKSHGILPRYFFAPSHTFDENTLIAIKEESDIRIISDTIARKPYKYRDFTIIPQLGGHCMEMKLPGIWTFCLHPSSMQDNDFEKTEAFLKAHCDKFCSFEELDLAKLKKKDVLSRLLSGCYFFVRRFKRLLK